MPVSPGCHPTSLSAVSTAGVAVSKPPRAREDSECRPGTPRPVALGGVSVAADADLHSLKSGNFRRPLGVSLSTPAAILCTPTTITSTPQLGVTLLNDGQHRVSNHGGDSEPDRCGQDDAEHEIPSRDNVDQKRYYTRVRPNDRPLLASASASLRTLLLTARRRLSRRSPLRSRRLIASFSCAWPSRSRQAWIAS